MVPAESADLAVLGARIRTLDARRPWATAVAVRDGRIAAVGDDAAVRAACGPRTELVDGTGLAIVPGLVDGHLHPIWAADLAQGVDASGCADREALGRALRAERDRIGPGEVVRAWSVDYALFPGEAMDGRVLEELAGGPALVVFFDLHTFLATPGVLALAGVTGAEPFPDASEIVVRDGRPTGELREFSAFYRVADALPGLTEGTRLRRVAAILAELNAVGLTGAHVMDGSPATFDLLRRLEERGDLTLRLVVPLWVKPEYGDDHVEAYLRHQGEAGGLWRGGVAKFFIDGVVETGTAWLEAPDTRGQRTKPFWPDPRRYADVVARLARDGGPPALGRPARARLGLARRAVRPPNTAWPGRGCAAGPGIEAARASSPSSASAPKPPSPATRPPRRRWSATVRRRAGSRWAAAPT